MSDNNCETKKKKRKLTQWEKRRPLSIEEKLEALCESHYEEIDHAETIQFTLLPPEKDNDIDLDDAPEEKLVVSEYNLHLLGKGVLAQSSEIQVITKDKEKHDVSAEHVIHEVPALSSKDLNVRPAKSETLHMLQESKIRKTITKSKPERKWLDVELRCESDEEVCFKVKNITEPRPAIIDKMIEEGSSP
ncbi:hypothetical protein ILUMI_15774, partial [Ignelater luminosus]